MGFKFAHIADCHLGGWADPALREMGMESFQRVVDTCIEKKVDFVILAGDIFDNSRPPIDVLDFTVKQLGRLSEKQIPVYAVSGSHDYSPSNRTMLKVLETAGLISLLTKASVGEKGLSLKFTVDEITGAKLTGMPGRKGGLEDGYYENLDRASLQEEEGFKIFVFHSAIQELVSNEYQQMKSLPLSFLPKGFDYYAAGHVHEEGLFQEEGYGPIVFPGATFPNNYRELERFEHGSFYIVDVDSKVRAEKQDIRLADICKMEVDADNKKTEEVEAILDEKIEAADVEGKIVLIRIEGIMKSGRVTEIPLRAIAERVREKGAVVVKTNTSKLSTKEYEEMQVKSEGKAQDELEEGLIREQAGEHSLGDLDKEQRVQLTKDLFKVLSDEQREGEKKKDYEHRIYQEAIKSLGLEEELDDVL